MKFIKLKLAVLLLLLMTSCGSDELTKSEAKSIMLECQEKLDKDLFKTNQYRYGIIDIPDIKNEEYSNLLNKHKEMEKLGLVTISEPKRDTREFGNSKGDIIEVDLTPKGKEFLVGRVDDMFGRKKAQFKSCEYEIKEIVEIQEIPERNEAMVKVNYKRIKETPFFEEANEKNNPKEFVETVSYRKITDGWKLCD